MRQWLTDSQGQLADVIYDRGAIKFGAFRLKLHEKNPDAPLSPIYITLRRPPDGPLTDEDIEAIGQELYALVTKKKVLFDFVAGIPRAGEPIAEVVSRLSRRPLLKLGKKIEGDTRKIDSIISGEYRPGQLVLLVTDKEVKGAQKSATAYWDLTSGLFLIKFWSYPQLDFILKLR